MIKNKNVIFTVKTIGLVQSEYPHGSRLCALDQ